MGSTGAPEWLIREDASQPVLLALYLRQVLGIRSPDELPHLRGIPPRANDRSEEAQALLERQWREYWAMTVEPTGASVARAARSRRRVRDARGAAHRGLPTCCAAAIVPHAAEALAFSQSAHERYRKDAAAKPGVSYRAYASAIAEHERQVGRRAHSFELNVQVLPLTQRGRVVDRLAHDRGHRRPAGGCRRPSTPRSTRSSPSWREPASVARRGRVSRSTITSRGARGERAVEDQRDDAADDDARR